MKYDSIGSFSARAFVASEALPVSGAIVRIYSNDEMNLGYDVSVLTGADGKTPVISLPAPDVSLSLSSGAPESAYATYNIEVTKDGFYPKKIENAAIFASTLSILPLNMVPDTGLTKNVTPPSTTDFSTVYENEEL
jgi:hypothetical protein